MSEANGEHQNVEQWMQEREHNREKRLLEKAAVSIFIRLYNLEHANKLRLLYQQEKPDAVLEDSRRHKLGLEITHLFYNESEARRLLGRSVEPESGTEHFHHLLSELNLLIRRKELKEREYNHHYPISLLIRNASPLFGMSDFKKAKNLISVSEKSFRDIWLLSRDGGKEWVLLKLT